MIIVKIDKDKQEGRCKCGGEIFFDGEGWYNMSEIQSNLDLSDNLPQVSNRKKKVKYKGYLGFCMDCRERIVAYISKNLLKVKE